MLSGYIPHQRLINVKKIDTTISKLANCHISIISHPSPILTKPINRRNKNHPMNFTGIIASLKETASIPNHLGHNTRSNVYIENNT